jgi:hypothetical protein
MAPTAMKETSRSALLVMVVLVVLVAIPESRDLVASVALRARVVSVVLRGPVVRRAWM